MKEKLPKGWILTSLGEITDKSQYGWTTRASPNGNLHLLRTTDITSGKIEWDSVPFCEKEPEDIGKYLLEDGDIVISRAGSVGHSYLLHNPKRSIFASYLIRFKPLVNRFYLFYFLRSSYYWEAISEKSIGIAMANVNASKLKQIEIPLPPLAEQQRIVNKIEELFTNLDKGVESLEEVKSKLKVYRQAILKYAMEGKLTEKWREENKDKIEPASILLDKIKEKKLKIEKFRKYSLIEKSILIKLPEEWTWTELINIAIKFQSGGTPLTKIDKYYENGTIPFVKIEDITNSKKYLYDTKIKITKEGLNNSSAWIVPENSILYSMYASYGIPTINKIKVATNQAIVGIVPPHNLINVEFIYYYLLYIKPGLKNLIRGTTQENLNAQIVSNIFFSLPPLEEQHKIVERIEQLFSLADYIEETVDSKLGQSKTLRQSILKKAFEGKLVPQDPNDEPAELLLEKIKKQKLNKEELVQEKLI